MKRFEKDFEDKFGETPTLKNKMSHPEYKQMSTTIICLKNNLKRKPTIFEQFHFYVLLVYTYYFI